MSWKNNNQDYSQRRQAFQDASFLDDLSYHTAQIQFIVVNMVIAGIAIHQLASNLNAWWPILIYGGATSTWTSLTLLSAIGDKVKIATMNMDNPDPPDSIELYEDRSDMVLDLLQGEKKDADKEAFKQTIIRDTVSNLQTSLKMLLPWMILSGASAPQYLIGGVVAGALTCSALVDINQSLSYKAQKRTAYKKLYPRLS